MRTYNTFNQYIDPKTTKPIVSEHPSYKELAGVNRPLPYYQEFMLSYFWTPDSK